RVFCGLYAEQISRPVPFLNLVNVMSRCFPHPDPSHEAGVWCPPFRVLGDRRHAKAWKPYEAARFWGPGREPQPLMESFPGKRGQPSAAFHFLNTRPTATTLWSA